MSDATDKKFEFKPTMSKIFPKVKLNYPVSPKENLQRVLDKKKPLWIPNMNYEKTLVICPHDNDRPPFGKSGKDWFGVDWSYVGAADGQMVTPNTFIMESPLKWEEKLIFPDLDSLDFTKGREEAEAKTDKSVMSFYLMQDGMFERLLSIAPTEEVFCFLAEEEESATKYFERMADYKIALMDKLLREWAPFDCFINSDDWGTQLSTFFSPEMYRKYIFKPTKRIVEFAHKNGKYVNFHSCGRIEKLIPQVVELKADMWEAQVINDLRTLHNTYGTQLAIQIRMNDDITFRSGVSDQAIIDHVHDYVDTYAGEGGVLATYMARDEHVNELIARELFEYSMAAYK